MATFYEARAVSFTCVTTLNSTGDSGCQDKGRLRSNSLPEPRHFRHLRQGLDLDSDLDRQSLFENQSLLYHKENNWEEKRASHNQLKNVMDHVAGDVVVISTECICSHGKQRDVAISPIPALTQIPLTNWNRWDFKRALEITGENLEDLLAYDDLFLDYFNAFLALPVFPQAMHYNRLTGAFEETDPNGIRSSLDSASGLPYGITDDERDSMLQWARRERLPLFLSTQLFREFKLCKLLLRPLDDRYLVSRGSSHQLRGYSRQSESYVSSLSNSADNSANDVDDEDFTFDGHFNASQLFKYQRPGSRALSVPAPIYYGYDPYFEVQRGSTTTHTHDTSKTTSIKHKPKKQKDELDAELVLDLHSGAYYPRESTVTFDPDTADPDSKSLRSHSRRSSKANRLKRSQAPQSDIEAAFLRHARVLSAPVNYEDYMKHPYRDFDMMFGEDEPEPDGNVYVTFEDEGASEAQTETDVKNLEGRLKMTFQQLKEHTMGTFLGMEDIKRFLCGTAGSQLVNFWLDCEFFKDTMEKFDEVDLMEKRNRLFRDIQDRYKIHLTKDAKDQISKAASNSNLSHSIFIRTQYDVLRRLRAYWVPRYMLHEERQRKIRHHSNGSDSNRWITMSNSTTDSYAFFPSINLVSSMPVRPDDALTYTKTKSWEYVSKGGRRLDDRVKSAKFRRDPLVSFSSTKERFIVALAADKMAGGPFERFLACHPDQSLLPNLLFWQDVAEYGAAEDRVADRLLRMCNAWAINNKYIADDSDYNIDMSQNERNAIHQVLMSTNDFVEASVFDSAKQHACNKLEAIWICFLKEDLKIFLDCRSKPGAPSPPGTAAIDITLTNDEVIISRPRPWLKRPSGTTETERARRLNADTSMEDLDEEQRAELRAKRREARKEMERERRKAVKAAYKRLRDSKKKPEDKKERDELDFDELGEKKASRPPPPFHETIANKAIITNFKKHLLEQEDRETFNMVGLFMDIEQFLSYGSNKKEAQRREQHAHFIQKTYIDSHGKKKVEFTDKIKGKLPDKERPKTPLLKEIQHSMHSKIDEQFKGYLTTKAEEQGIDPGDLVKLSQAELTMRLGNDTSMGNWRKTRGGKGKDESSSTTTPRGTGSSQMYRRPKRARFNAKTGRSQPHKDDREEFYKALKLSASGKMTLPMLYFYKYLLKHGEEDNMPLIDKDLFFYVEVQKFKDGSHQFADEEILRRKVQSLIDCFLESITTPNLQIDVNTEVHQKTLRAAQRYVAGKDVFSNIFDEAQLCVFKELLPYWAGFRKSFSPPDDPNKKPVTKYQKMLKKRLENIDNYEIPSNEFHLPAIPEGAIAAFTFSLADGVKVRELLNGEDPHFTYIVDSSARSSKIDLRGNTGKRRQSISMNSIPGAVSTGSSKKESSTASVKT